MRKKKFEEKKPSSGFGKMTVGKFGSGISCSSVRFIGFNPNVSTAFCAQIDPTPAFFWKKNI